jgi:prefoldin subunit 5
MEKEKLLEIISDIKNKSNKDLFSAIEILSDEFENTKQLIVEMTKHLDIIEEYYNMINNEIKKRHEGL